jgi:hypothetical protein
MRLKADQSDEVRAFWALGVSGRLGDYRSAPLDALGQRSG